jgi:hypothetical protein
MGWGEKRLDGCNPCHALQCMPLIFAGSSPTLPAPASKTPRAPLKPEVKPGCVLRRSNFSVLEREKLVDNKQVEQCKKRMNTFGFVGDLSGDPQVCGGVLYGGC